MARWFGTAALAIAVVVLLPFVLFHASAHADAGCVLCHLPVSVQAVCPTRVDAVVGQHVLGTVSPYAQQVNSDPSPKSASSRAPPR